MQTPTHLALRAALLTVLLVCFVSPGGSTWSTGARAEAPETDAARFLQDVFGFGSRAIQAARSSQLHWVQ